MFCSVWDFGFLNKVSNFFGNGSTDSVYFCQLFFICTHDCFNASKVFQQRLSPFSSNVWKTLQYIELAGLSAFGTIPSPLHSSIGKPNALFRRVAHQPNRFLCIHRSQYR